MNQDTLVIAGSIFGAVYVLATFAYLIFRRYMQHRQEELRSERAKLDDFRAHLERQLMELNYKFASSEGRWQELNHLVVAGQKEREVPRGSLKRLATSEFLLSHGIDVAKLETREDLIFVLTPFHDDLLDEFLVVTQIGQTLGFTVNRGDELASKGDIFPQLLRLLVTAKVVIANISGRNPNVFYELGIAHALDRSVILLAHSGTDVPFDVQSKRIVFYKSNEELRERLTQTLARTLISKDA
jgi:hypothetical protein